MIYQWRILFVLASFATCCLSAFGQVYHVEGRLDGRYPLSPKRDDSYSIPFSLSVSNENWSIGGLDNTLGFSRRFNAGGDAEKVVAMSIHDQPKAKGHLYDHEASITSGPAPEFDINYRLIWLALASSHFISDTNNRIMPPWRVPLEFEFKKSKGRDFPYTLRLSPDNPFLPKTLSVEHPPYFYNKHTKVSYSPPFDITNHVRAELRVISYTNCESLIIPQEIAYAYSDILPDSTGRLRLTEVFYATITITNCSATNNDAVFLPALNGKRFLITDHRTIDSPLGINRLMQYEWNEREWPSLNHPKFLALVEQERKSLLATMSGGALDSLGPARRFVYGMVIMLLLLPIIVWLIKERNLIKQKLNQKHEKQ